jgi:hypothetical protein
MSNIEKNERHAPAVASATPAAAVVLAPQDMTSEQLGQSIREKHASMLRAFKASVVTAIEVGELLVEAKKRVGHGNFEGWVKDHCGFSYRSARRYTQMARDKDKLLAQLNPNNAALGDLSATRLLAKPSGSASSDTPATVAASDKYDRAEERLIEKLQELPVDAADDLAATTISKLKATVATMRKGATNKAA